MLISQAAQQDLTVLMVSSVAVLKHETSTLRQNNILYQLNSNVAWLIKLGRLPTLPNLVRIRWAAETPRGAT